MKMNKLLIFGSLIALLLVGFVVAEITTSKEITYPKDDKAILDKLGYATATLSNVSCYKTDCYYYIYRGTNNRLRRPLGEIAIDKQTDSNLKILQETDYKNYIGRLIINEKVLNNYTSKSNPVIITIGVKK